MIDSSIKDQNGCTVYRRQGALTAKAPIFPDNLCRWEYNEHSSTFTGNEAVDM